MARYSRDPRWISARYPGSCHGCGEAFSKGDSVFYLPIGRKALVGECAEKASLDFEAAKFDEEG